MAEKRPKFPVVFGKPENEQRASPTELLRPFMTLELPPSLLRCFDGDDIDIAKFCALRRHEDEQLEASIAAASQRQEVKARIIL